MALIYKKNRVFLLTHCKICGKGIFNICDFICKNCKKNSCNQCGRQLINIKYHSIIKCIPVAWTNNIYLYTNFKYSAKCALELREALVVLTSACRYKNINMQCSINILSYYYKAKISNKD